MRTVVVIVRVIVCEHEETGLSILTFSYTSDFGVSGRTLPAVVRRVFRCDFTDDSCRYKYRFFSKTQSIVGEMRAESSTNWH